MARKDKTTPLTPVPPKGHNFTDLDEKRYELYLKHAPLGRPVKNKNDYISQFHR